MRKSIILVIADRNGNYTRLVNLFQESSDEAAVLMKKFLDPGEQVLDAYITNNHDENFFIFQDTPRREVRNDE